MVTIMPMNAIIPGPWGSMSEFDPATASISEIISSVVGAYATLFVFKFSVGAETSVLEV